MKRGDDTIAASNKSTQFSFSFLCFSFGLVSFICSIARFNFSEASNRPILVQCTYSHNYSDCTWSFIWLSPTSRASLYVCAMCIQWKCTSDAIQHTFCLDMCASIALVTPMKRCDPINTSSTSFEIKLNRIHSVQHNWIDKLQTSTSSTVNCVCRKNENRFFTAEHKERIIFLIDKRTYCSNVNRKRRRIKNNEKKKNEMNRKQTKLHPDPILRHRQRQQLIFQLKLLELVLVSPSTDIFCRIVAFFFQSIVCFVSDRKKIVKTKAKCFVHHWTWQPAKSEFFVCHILFHPSFICLSNRFSVAQIIRFRRQTTTSVATCFLCISPVQQTVQSKRAKYIEADEQNA